MSSRAERLPPELSDMIASLLAPDDLRSLALVSRFWKNAADRSLFRTVAFNHPKMIAAFPRSAARHVRAVQISTLMKECDSWSGAHACSAACWPALALPRFPHLRRVDARCVRFLELSAPARENAEALFTAPTLEAVVLDCANACASLRFGPNVRSVALKDVTLPPVKDADGAARLLAERGRGGRRYVPPSQVLTELSIDLYGWYGCNAFDHSASLLRDVPVFLQMVPVHNVTVLSISVCSSLSERVDELLRACRRLVDLKLNWGSFSQCLTCDPDTFTQLVPDISTLPHLTTVTVQTWCITHSYTIFTRALQTNVLPASLQSLKVTVPYLGRGEPELACALYDVAARAPVQVVFHLTCLGYTSWRDYFWTYYLDRRLSEERLSEMTRILRSRHRRGVGARCPAFVFGALLSAEGFELKNRPRDEVGKHAMQTLFSC